MITIIFLVGGLLGGWELTLTAFLICILVDMLIS